MRKIASCLLILIVILVIQAFYALASWGETMTVANNQITTGTADLQVSTSGVGGGNWHTSEGNSSLTINNLVPGGSYVDEYDFSVLNNSSEGITLGLFARLAATINDENVDKSKLLLNLYENGTNLNTGSYTSGWLSLSEWKTGLHSLNSQLTQGSIKDYRLAVKLDESASEDWQGRTINLRVNLTGQQQ